MPATSLTAAPGTPTARKTGACREGAPACRFGGRSGVLAAMRGQRPRPARRAGVAAGEPAPTRGAESLVSGCRFSCRSGLPIVTRGRPL